MNKLLTTALIMGLASSAASVQAYEAGDRILRMGAVTVAPNEDSDKIVLPTSPPTVLEGVSVDDDTQLSIIGAYMLSANYGVELLAATPFEHDIGVKGVGIDAGTTKQLPPTLIAQWYPRGNQSGWQPYVGIGVNYTIFFDESIDSELGGALGAIIGASKADLELDDSFGLAAQAGIDFPLNDSWAINVGLWYIDIGTTAKIKTDVGTVKFDVDIDPWVYNIGFAYKF
jgi:outer membrane protein